MENEKENEQYNGAQTAREVFAGIGMDIDVVMDSSMGRILEDDSSGRLKIIFDGVVEKVIKLVEENRLINEIQLTDEEKELISMVSIAVMADAFKAMLDATSGNSDIMKDET